MGNRAYNKHKRRALRDFFFGKPPNRRAKRATGAKKKHYVTESSARYIKKKR